MARLGLSRPPPPRHGINAVSPGRNVLGALGLGSLATGGAYAAMNPAATADLFGRASDATFRGMKGVYNPGYDPNAPGEAAFAQYIADKDRFGGFGPEPDPDDVDYNATENVGPNFMTNPNYNVGSAVRGGRGAFHEAADKVKSFVGDASDKAKSLADASKAEYFSGAYRDAGQGGAGIDNAADPIKGAYRTMAESAARSAANKTRAIGDFASMFSGQ